MGESQVCPWCMTEIVWDEEIGPESHCPHCENELSGYRSLNIGLDNDEDLDDEEQGGSYGHAQDDGDGDWEDESSLRGMGTGLASEAGAQLVLEQQLEVPECPVCREYMLEAGEQQIGGDNFKAHVSPALGHSIVPVPFTVNWYVCPSCYHVSSQLAVSDREELAKRLHRAE
ncbi:hypothetical protein ACX93W_09715 [Paenibacillus sp. CAU 1782]